MKSRQALFEALDWGVFSLGGIITAFLLPVNIVVTLLLQQPIPRGALLSFPILPLTKLYLFILLIGATWHALHRIRFILLGFGLSHYRKAVTITTMIVLSLIIVYTFKIIFFAKIF